MDEQTEAFPARAGAQRHGAARYDHAFIVTYGRSGSTLLQGILNAIPGYLVLGENYDMMRMLEGLYRRLPRFTQRGSKAGAPPAPTQASNPFFRFENYQDATYRESLRLFVDNILLHGADPGAVRCVGFKEIRYTPDTVKRKVDFLRTVFPGCAIIYNIRNPHDVVASEFQKSKEAPVFEQFNAHLAALAEADPHACLVRYEDVARGAGSLVEMFGFLGETFDRAVIDGVLAVKHSYHKRSDAQVYSDVPRYVQVNRALEGFAVLVTDRFDAKDGSVRIGGLMVSRENAPPRRFRQVLDGEGNPVKFKAATGMPSPRFGDKLKNEAARAARFSVSFTRASDEEHRVFFDDGELALIVRAAGPELAGLTAEG